MGGWLSYMWWGGDPDAADPFSGLSRRDIHAVQKSWAPVYQNALGSGTELLRRLFTTYPETRDFFKMVQKTPESKWMENPQFRAHVLNLMTSLNLAIVSLHQPEVVAAMMNKIGESHRKRKVKEEHFLDLKNVIVKMFVELLNMDDATLGSWGKAVDFLYTSIFQTLNDDATR